MQEQPKKDSILEALEADVNALGGPKVVAPILWPEKEKDPTAAGKHLTNCLREDRAERLTPEQVALIIRRARHVGSFETLFFICDDASMTRPTPIEPEDVRVQVMRDFIKRVDSLSALAEQIKKGL